MYNVEHGGSFRKTALKHVFLPKMMYIGPGSRHSNPEESSNLDHLLDALRCEMLEYSGLLVMLREQEKHIIQQQSADLVANTTQISDQLKLVSRARDKRERCMHDYIDELDHALKSRQLTHQGLGTRRKQLSGLVAQINDLLGEIQSHLKRNHDLLQDLVCPMEKILNRIVWN